jgi:hypothetical protein
MIFIKKLSFWQIFSIKKNATAIINSCAGRLFYEASIKSIKFESEKCKIIHNQ